MWPLIIARIAAAAAPIIAAACARYFNEDQGCFVDTPNGKVPCDKTVIPPPPPPTIDKDGDGVPDIRDLCPDEPHFGSPDGCAPKCETDKDGDGINDCDDQCPDVEGLPEAGGCTELSTPITMDLFRLEPQRQDTFVIPQSPVCAHLDTGFGSTPSIFWSDGSNLFMRSSPDTGDVPLRSSMGHPIDLCHLRKSVARDEAGNINVAWVEGSAGERAYVYFQRFSSAGTALGNQFLLDSFPMPNLNADNDASVASLAMKSDGTAVVVWVNRDKVLLKEISPTGDPSESTLVNIRSETVERNISPDVSISGNGDTSVVWQEGRRETGPIWRAIFKAGNLNPAQGFVANVGKSPRVSIADGVAMYVWEKDGVSMMAERDNGSNYVPLWSINLQRPGEQNPLLINPMIYLDQHGRLTNSWMDSGVGSGASSIWFRSLNYYGFATTSSASAPILVDRFSRSRWMDLAASYAEDSFAILYPNLMSDSYQLNQYKWEGSDALMDGAAISIYENPIELGRRESVPFRIRNSGVKTLEAQWRIGDGCKIKLNDGSLVDEGSDSIASSTEKLRMLVCDTQTTSSSITLTTNDYRHPEMAVPIRR